MSALRECNLILNTSITEGMSQALLEAMDFEIPILARANDGNKELIIHNWNGLLFNNL